MTIFEDGPNLDSERLPAYIALVQAWPVALALQFADLLFAFAVRANGAIRPKLRFNKSVGGFFIVEAGIG
ncbi:hypothetical protein SBDP1_1350001 [Syntrophobacter sp. SbD1]|nr:hypothetical protein SBDP1_1350001 [Syntrophobacter sp. SbD1]